MRGSGLSDFKHLSLICGLVAAEKLTKRSKATVMSSQGAHASIKSASSECVGLQDQTVKSKKLCFVRSDMWVSLYNA